MRRLAARRTAARARLRARSGSRPCGRTRAPGDHLERADRVRVGRIGHRERQLRSRPRAPATRAPRAGIAPTRAPRGSATRDSRRRRRSGKPSCVGERLGDVALRDHAERDQQRAELLAGSSCLQPQRALEVRADRACRARSGSRRVVFFPVRSHLSPHENQRAIIAWRAGAEGPRSRSNQGFAAVCQCRLSPSDDVRRVECRLRPTFAADFDEAYAVTRSNPTR